jgi:hypothetical protein
MQGGKYLGFTEVVIEPGSANIDCRSRAVLLALRCLLWLCRWGRGLFGYVCRGPAPDFRPTTSIISASYLLEKPRRLNPNMLVRQRRCGNLW